MKKEERLAALTSVLKLAFTRPQFQSMLSELGLDTVYDYQELVQLVNDTRDIEAMALLKLASGSEDLNIDQQKWTCVRDKLYMALESSKGFARLRGKIEFADEFKALNLEEVVFFLRLIGNCYLEKEGSGSRPIFAYLFERLADIANVDESANLTAIQEKHRIFAE